MVWFHIPTYLYHDFFYHQRTNPNSLFYSLYHIEIVEHEVFLVGEGFSLEVMKYGEASSLTRIRWWRDSVLRLSLTKLVLFSLSSWAYAGVEDNFHDIKIFKDLDSSTHQRSLNSSQCSWSWAREEVVFFQLGHCFTSAVGLTV